DLHARRRRSPADADRVGAGRARAARAGRRAPCRSAGARHAGGTVQARELRRALLRGAGGEMTTIFAALIRRSAAQMRYAVLGSLVLTFVMQLVLVGQAVSIQESQSFANVASLIPNFIGRGLGSEALLLASFKGTVMLGYF